MAYLRMWVYLLEYLNATLWNSRKCDFISMYDNKLLACTLWSVSEIINIVFDHEDESKIWSLTRVKFESEFWTLRLSDIQIWVLSWRRMKVSSLVSTLKTWFLRSSLALQFWSLKARFPPLTRYFSLGTPKGIFMLTRGYVCNWHRLFSPCRKLCHQF